MKNLFHNTRIKYLLKKEKLDKSDIKYVIKHIDCLYNTVFFYLEKKPKNFHIIFDFIKEDFSLIDKFIKKDTLLYKISSFDGVHKSDDLDHVFVAACYAYCLKDIYIKCLHYQLSKAVSFMVISFDYGSAFKYFENIFENISPSAHNKIFHHYNIKTGSYAGFDVSSGLNIMDLIGIYLKSIEQKENIIDNNDPYRLLLKKLIDRGFYFSYPELYMYYEPIINLELMNKVHAVQLFSMPHDDFVSSISSINQSVFQLQEIQFDL